MFDSLAALSSTRAVPVLLACAGLLNIALLLINVAFYARNRRRARRLRALEGRLDAGPVTAVLTRPGSGASDLAG
jgi:hypothetical protein